MAFALFSGVSVQTLNAQNSEIGATVGTMFYLGELNPSKLFAQPKLAAGLVYRYNLSPRWALKADFLFGKVAGSDALTNGGYAARWLAATPSPTAATRATSASTRPSPSSPPWPNSTS